MVRQWRMSSRAGAGPQWKETAPSPLLVRRPSGTTTRKCTKLPWAWRYAGRMAPSHRALVCRPYAALVVAALFVVVIAACGGTAVIDPPLDGASGGSGAATTTSSHGGTAGTGGTQPGPTCHNGVCEPGEDCATCPECCPPGVCEGNTGFDGCRGHGCSVCVELVGGYTHYFVNHPSCSLNTTCDGAFFACNDACPAPSSADL